MALQGEELKKYIERNALQYSWATLAQGAGMSEADIRAFANANAVKPVTTGGTGELGDPHAIQQQKTADEIAQRRLTDQNNTPATGPTLTGTAAPVSTTPNPYATTRAYEPELFQTEKTPCQPSPNETAEQYNARIDAANGVKPAAPAPVPTSPQDALAMFQSGKMTAPQYNAWAVKQSGVSAIDASYQKKPGETPTQYGEKMAAADTEIKRLTAENKNITTGPIEDILSPWRDKLETAERERLLVEKNFMDNQAAVDELKTLLTEGNAQIAAEQGVTGLASIRDPRVGTLKENIAARAGVLQAVINARNGQIGVANNLIDRSLNAMTADKNDQLKYYGFLIDLNDELKTDEQNKVKLLDGKQTTYVAAQMEMLQADLNQKQAMATYIKELMINPATAEAVQKAGVTLNDSYEQIQAKFAQYAYTKNVTDELNKLTSTGYVQLAPGQTSVGMVSFKDSKGVTYNFKPPAESVSTAVKEVGGRQILYNSKTGATIKDLGPVTKESDVKKEEETVKDFNSDVFGWDWAKSGETREQFIRRLQSKYSAVEPSDVQRKIYEVYPNGYDS